MTVSDRRDSSSQQQQQYAQGTFAVGDDAAVEAMPHATALTQQQLDAVSNNNNDSVAAKRDGGDDDAIDATSRRVAIIGYFGTLFGTAAINAFVGLVLSEKGFTPTQVGMLVNTVPLSNMLLLPVVSFIADKYRCAVAILCACAVASTLCVAAFCVATQHAIVVVSFIFLTLTQTPMGPLLDRHTLMLFPAARRADTWGYVRAFGAYGWGAGNFAASATVWLCGTWSVVVVQYVLGQAALLYCMCSTTAYVAPSDAPVRLRDVVLLLWRHPRLLLFLVASCIMGMGYSVINTYLFIFLDELHAPTVLLGLTVVFTISTEVPLFQYSRYMYRYVTYRQMMTGAMLLWATRVAGYSLLTGPWYVLLLEPLHGITFGFVWLPGIKALSSTFPPQLASCATGVLSAFVNGLGPLMGNPLGGLLYDRLGARNMFRIAAVAMLTALVLYHVIDRTLEHYGWTLGVYKDVHTDNNAATTVTIVRNHDEKDDSKSNDRNGRSAVDDNTAASATTLTMLMRSEETVQVITDDQLPRQRRRQQK